MDRNQLVESGKFALCIFFALLFLILPSILLGPIFRSLHSQVELRLLADLAPGVRYSEPLSNPDPDINSLYRMTDGSAIVFGQAHLTVQTVAYAARFAANGRLQDMRLLEIPKPPHTRLGSLLPPLFQTNQNSPIISLKAPDTASADDDLPGDTGQEYTCMARALIHAQTALRQAVPK